MATLARSIGQSESFWRYVDAYFPRIFGLCLHTALVAQYGLAEYAMPAWLLGVLGMLLAAVPDPHSFVLVRRHGEAASRLLALTTPWLLLKVAAASLLSWITLHSAGSGLLTGGAEAKMAALGTLWFGSVEFLWSVLGTTSLATGKVRKVAITGVLARLGALLLLTVGWVLHCITIGESMFIAGFPTAIALVALLPLAVRHRRSLEFMIFSMRRYALWNQGISLVTVALFQLPSFVLGAASLGSPAGVGQLSYLSRIMQAALQPLQIMQAMVIRDTVKARSGQDSGNLLTMRRVFRIGGAVLFITGAAVMGTMYSRAPIATPVAAVSISFVLGVSFSAWYRFELSQLLASMNVRRLLLRGYLPVLSGTILLVSSLTPLWGPVGLATAVLAGWVALSLCWKWI